MPGLDPGHLILFFLIALIVFGPERMQELARSLGKAVAEFQRASQGLPDLLNERPSASVEDGTGDQSGERRMTLIEHIAELRIRIVKSAVAILVAATVAYFFSDEILRLLKAPAGADFQINAFSPMDGFVIRWKVALYGGVVLASPIWAYELLAFIAPGLTARERRFVFPMLVAMAILFLLGTVFGYVMLSGMVRILVDMFGREINYLPNANQYISFVVFFMLACGLAFELPIAVLALVKVGILKADSLKRQRRIAYFLLFVFAELVTPVADPIVAPMIVMTPLVILYEAAIFATRFVAPRPERKAAPASTSG